MLFRQEAELLSSKEVYWGVSFEQAALFLTSKWGEGVSSRQVALFLTSKWGWGGGGSGDCLYSGQAVR